MPKVRIDDTLEMDYEDDNFTDPWKTPETLVLQPCNGGSNRLYYRWVPVVARHYRMLRLNRRGQGQSTIPAPGYPWSLGGWSQEMLGFLDRLGLQQVHVMGEATGAYVSVQFAYEHPDRVKSLTLINCSAGKFAEIPKMAEFAKLFEEQGVEGWVRNSMPDRFDPSQVDPEYIEWHALEKLRQTHYVLEEVAKFDLSDVDVTDLLPQIKAPTLVIASGIATGIYTQETTDRLQRLIPNCKVVSIPGIFGYVAHAAPEQCAEAWLDFARGLG